MKWKKIWQKLFNKNFAIQPDAENDCTIKANSIVRCIQSHNTDAYVRDMEYEVAYTAYGCRHYPLLLKLKGVEGDSSIDAFTNVDTKCFQCNKVIHCNQFLVNAKNFELVKR